MMRNIWRHLHDVPDTRARDLVVAVVVSPLVADLDHAYQHVRSQDEADAIVAAASGIIASAAFVPVGWRADA